MGYEKNRSCVQRELCVCVLSHFSRVQLFVTLWTVAHQAPLSKLEPGLPSYNENIFVECGA